MRIPYRAVRKIKKVFLKIFAYYYYIFLTLWFTLIAVLLPAAGIKMLSDGLHIVIAVLMLVITFGLGGAMLRWGLPVFIGRLREIRHADAYGYAPLLKGWCITTGAVLGFVFLAFLLSGIFFGFGESSAAQVISAAISCLTVMPTIHYFFTQNQRRLKRR